MEQKSLLSSTVEILVLPFQVIFPGHYILTQFQLGLIESLGCFSKHFLPHFLKSYETPLRVASPITDYILLTDMETLLNQGYYFPEKKIQ